MFITFNSWKHVGIYLFPESRNLDFAILKCIVLHNKQISLYTIIKFFIYPFRDQPSVNDVAENMTLKNEIFNMHPKTVAKTSILALHLCLHFKCEVLSCCQEVVELKWFCFDESSGKLLIASVVFNWKYVFFSY